MGRSKSRSKSKSKQKSPQTQSPPPSAKTKTPTETLTSINAQNLFNLSLVCFSISLILFVSTYSMITNNGGGAALFGSTATIATITTLPNASLEANNNNNNIKNNIKKNTKNNDEQHGELLVGYKILHHTLKKESQLKYLHWLRDATFRGPKGSLKTLLTTIYTTSQTRTNELENTLFGLFPVVALNETPKSAMGDSIQDDVEKSSTAELVPIPSLSSSSSSNTNKTPYLEWGVRFVFIQAQATRMVVALAMSLKKFEQNEERKQWLTELADEYEAIRESLVDSMLLNLGEGSWKEA